MTEFELNNIKDRVVQLEAKIANMHPNWNTIFGKNVTHIDILNNGLDTLRTMLKHGGYHYSVVAGHLGSLESYYTLINKAQ